MRKMFFAAAAIMMVTAGLATTVDAACYWSDTACPLQGQDGGTATGGPAGGLPDRN
jgi:hypothetical protein